MNGKEHNKRYNKNKMINDDLYELVGGWKQR